MARAAGDEVGSCPALRKDVRLLNPDLISSRNLFEMTEITRTLDEYVNASLCGARKLTNRNSGDSSRELGSALTRMTTREYRTKNERVKLNRALRAEKTVSP